MFENYIKNGRYLKGWSPKTEVVYQRAFTSFQQSQRELPHGGFSSADILTKARLEAWVVWMRQKGLAPACINIYIRAMNAYCSWLKEEGILKEQIKVKQVPAPLKQITVFSDSDIRAILAFRAAGFYELRTWTLLCLLLDTGCRINELLDILEENHIDLENLLLTVNGKGNKPRKVPFSTEVRKLLFRYFQVRHKKGIKGYFFGNRDGGKLRYRNIYRDILALCKKVGITKRVHPHLTRHTFACHFMKNGGSIYTLSRILGHSSINTTQTYVRGLGVEDFHEEHARLSPLAVR